jgi:hypothetical protein
MGFFSFKTQDTLRSISNEESKRGTFTVFMHDNKGNVYKESNYAGFGEFGGVDYYELLAEMNGLKTRSQGIDLAYSGKAYKAPNLTETAVWDYTNEAPQRCENQGYFYESGMTFDLIEDQDGEYYIVEDMGLVYYLTDLIVLDLDVINNKVTVAI